MILSSFPFLRSFHGFRMTVSSLRDWLVPTLELDPATLCTYSTSGRAMR